MVIIQRIYLMKFSSKTVWLQFKKRNHTSHQHRLTKADSNTKQQWRSILERSSRNSKPPRTIWTISKIKKNLFVKCMWSTTILTWYYCQTTNLQTPTRISHFLLYQFHDYSSSCKEIKNQAKKQRKYHRLFITALLKVKKNSNLWIFKTHTKSSHEKVSYPTYPFKLTLTQKNAVSLNRTGFYLSETITSDSIS